MPVHVLPKLEYQLSYGVECLTNSEACQLWTETSLHSSTVPYIGKNTQTKTRDRPIMVGEKILLIFFKISVGNIAQVMFENVFPLLCPLVTMRQILPHTSSHLMTHSAAVVV